MEKTHNFLHWTWTLVFYGEVLGFVTQASSSLSDKLCGSNYNSAYNMLLLAQTMYELVYYRIVSMLLSLNPVWNLLINLNNFKFLFKSSSLVSSKWWATFRNNYKSKSQFSEDIWSAVVGLEAWKTVDFIFLCDCQHPSVIFVSIQYLLK